MLLCRRSKLGLSLFFALIQASREHQTRDSITSFSESLELLHKKTYIEAAVIVYISFTPHFGLLPEITRNLFPEIYLLCRV